MGNKQDLLNLIDLEIKQFSKLKSINSIVPNSIPIVWFGDVEKYYKSGLKIITVSLNPSDNEFKLKKTDPYSTEYRFPAYDGDVNSLYTSYNEYFYKKSYGGWFKSSFKAALKSFDASHYNGEKNTALHTDIGSPYATNPTWSGLTGQRLPDRQKLESLGSTSWHNLIKILEPDVILFSASNSFEQKIKFQQIGKWKEFEVKANRPLLSGKFQIAAAKLTSILFQVQGRKPFLQTSEEEKLKFNKYI
jgi:hypothetical protein